MTGLERLCKVAADFAKNYPQYTKYSEPRNDFAARAAESTNMYAQSQSQDTHRMKEVPRDVPEYAQTVTNDEKPATTHGAALYGVNKLAGWSEAFNYGFASHGTGYDFSKQIDNLQERYRAQNRSVHPPVDSYNKESDTTGADIPGTLFDPFGYRKLFRGIDSIISPAVKRRITAFNKSLPLGVFHNANNNYWLA